MSQEGPEAVGSSLPESTSTLLSEYQIQLDRTVDLLTSMPLARLERPGESGSVADRAFSLSASIVATGDVLVGSMARELPRLRAHGAGVQLAVVGQELAATIESGDVDFVSADLALMDLVSRLLEFRRSSG